VAVNSSELARVQVRMKVGERVNVRIRVGFKVRA